MIFKNHAGKSNALLMELIFHHEKFIHGKIFPRNQIPQAPHQKKFPEYVCILTNNQFYM